MIKIMADSTCDLSQDVIEKYEIGIAPLNIVIEGKTYRDGVDISNDEFYQLLENSKEHLTTSMPSPNEYIEIIEKAVENGYKEILCICMSSGTSGAYQSAVIAKDLYYKENGNSPIKIYVVDSLSMSHGSGWLILKSAQLRDEGYSFEQLIEFNENYKRKVKHFLCVDDLDNLIKSGRLMNASAFIGKLLKIKPIMTMKDSKGVITAKVRGRKRALEYYIEEFIKRVDLTITNFIIMGYTTNKEIAENLRSKLREETDFLGDIYIMQMGAAVGTHVGSGGLSMFFVEKDKHAYDLRRTKLRKSF